MISKIINFADNIFSKLHKFYVANNKKIFTSLLCLSAYPFFKKFQSQIEENMNKIHNYLTYEDYEIRKKSLSDIKYKVLFDFNPEEIKILNEKNSQFSIGGIINIEFNFDIEKFCKNKKFLKIDYQGEVSSIILNSKNLINKIDFFINSNNVFEHYICQEKNCIFIKKEILLKENVLILEFRKNIFNDNSNSKLINPFLSIDRIKTSKNIYEKVFLICSLKIYNIGIYFFLV